MRALTIKRPWDYALLHGKNVENRPARPPKALIGERIALHAGLGFDYAGAGFIRRTLGMEGQVPQVAAGAIFATAKLVGWVERGTGSCARLGASVLMSSPELEWALRSPWFFGPVGIVLDDIRKLVLPVPARGMNGWWPVSAEVEARVRAQYLDDRFGCPEPTP